MPNKRSTRLPDDEFQVLMHVFTEHIKLLEQIERFCADIKGTKSIPVHFPGGVTKDYIWRDGVLMDLEGYFGQFLRDVRDSRAKTSDGLDS